MKTTALLSLALLCSTIAFAQQPPIAPRPPEPPMLPPLPNRPLRAPEPPHAAPEKEPVNYVVTVKWSDVKAGTNFLQVLTTPGSFNLDAMQATVRVGNNDVPTTVSFKGTLTEINTDKVNVQVFLGRTVPYVTGTYTGGASGATSSSYQQMRVGLDSHFVVTLGKAVVIQSDQNGEVTLSVKRQEN
jgi:expansin (peptidoglycan-binding protein)